MSSMSAPSQGLAVYNALSVFVGIAILPVVVAIHSPYRFIVQLTVVEPVTKPYSTLLICRYDEHKPSTGEVKTA